MSPLAVGASINSSYTSVALVHVVVAFMPLPCILLAAITTPPAGTLTVPEGAAVVAASEYTS